MERLLCILLNTLGVLTPGVPAVNGPPRNQKKQRRNYFRRRFSNPVIYLNDTSLQGSFSKSGCLPFLMA